MRAQLGNPRITFITGPPGSGKGTQCQKLVEEFGYTHISTGDLIRMEMKKGTRDGDRLKQFVDQGKNAPLELTVQLLINALIASPSQNYLIDGFPREVDQCTYFETNVCEAQNVLFFECSLETCKERIMGRGQGRSDDNDTAVSQRFQTYEEKNLPVIEYYEQFSKVRRIDANRDVLEIYEDTRRAMLPQISCMIGPKASGKTSMGNALCERTNMKMINYNSFVAEKNLGDCDEETATAALIKHLSKEISPRVLLEDFPQSEFQAKFFIKNCVEPSRVFSLECSKDVCQERMISLAQSDENYQASAILSKRIRMYNENAQKLMPYLKSATNLRSVNTEQNFDQAFKQICSFVEPTILMVRPGGNDDSFMMRSEISNTLQKEKGFHMLAVFNLIKEETERHTEVGREINAQISAGKDYMRDLDHLIVKMLKKIIYSGIEGRDKFILWDFPDTIKQVQEFESNCCKITAAVMAAGGKADANTIEIIDNGLSVESIDSLLQKDNRLKPMRAWDESTFNAHLGNKTDWAIVMGQPLSGKSLVSKLISDNANGKVIDLAKMAEDIRPRLETEDGPFEGRIPDAEVEKDILAIVEADKAAGDKFLYLFDGQHHESIDAMATFLLSNMGTPSYMILLSVSDEKEIENRFKEKNEITEDLGEEDVNALKEKKQQSDEDIERLKGCWWEVMSRIKVINLATDCSKESLTEDIRSKFCAKVILVNHEKRIEVDTACSNLAIKYNMLYISVYQLLKAELAAETDLGKALALSRNDKALDFGHVAKADPFNEREFSAVNFEPTLVMQLVQQKIGENRTSQRYILLEGFCNSSRLEEKEQRLQLRFMDEFFAIERCIGEVVGVIALSNELEPTTYDLPQDCYEEPCVEEPKVEEAPKADDDADADEAPADGDEKKAPTWNPKEYRWSVTNGRAKNLPVLFRSTKGGVVGKTLSFDEKNWTSYAGHTSHGDAAVKALDEFCQKVNEEGHSLYQYQQVIFNDLD